MAVNDVAARLLSVMAQLAQRTRYSYQEYLDLEEVSNVKHEYFDGAIYAMQSMRWPVEHPSAQHCPSR